MFKKMCLLVIVFVVLAIASDFTEGYKIGYCYGQQHCYPPYSPYPPYPKYGKNAFEGGYNRGFLDGLAAKRKATLGY